jgi:hypothetical protein
MRAPTPIPVFLPACVLATFACTAYHQPSEEDKPIVAKAAPIVPVIEPRQLDRRADAPAGVTGIVRRETGEPLAGATVCAWNVDPNADDRTPRCTTTDPGGNYALLGLVPTHHEVHASAGDRQPVAHPELLAFRPGERREGIDLQLAPGGAPIHGVVRDVHGQAIAGAWVTNFSHEPDEQVRHRGAAAIQSAADGAFTLWLSPGSHNLTAHAPGFVSATLGDAAAPGRNTLELEPGSTLAGQVVEVSGTPVVGARVVVMDSSLPRRVGLAYTDADGHYAIGGLPAGR